jgi:hypothetical protein
LLVLAVFSLFAITYYTRTAIPYSIANWMGGTLGAGLVLLAVLAITKQRSKFQTAFVFGVAAVFAAGTGVNGMLSRYSEQVAALKATEAILSGKDFESSDPLSTAIESYRDGLESAFLDYDALLNQVEVNKAFEPQILASVTEATIMRESLRNVVAVIPEFAARGNQTWIKFESDMTEIGTETALDFLAGAMRKRDESLDLFREYFRIQNGMLESFIDMQTLAIDSGGIGLEGDQYILPDDDALARFNTILSRIEAYSTEEEGWNRRRDQGMLDAQQQTSEMRRSTGM